MSTHIVLQSISKTPLGNLNQHSSAYKAFGDSVLPIAYKPECSTSPVTPPPAEVGTTYFQIFIQEDKLDEWSMQSIHVLRGEGLSRPLADLSVTTSQAGSAVICQVSLVSPWAGASIHYIFEVIGSQAPLKFLDQRTGRRTGRSWVQYCIIDLGRFIDCEVL